MTYRQRSFAFGFGALVLSALLTSCAMVQPNTTTPVVASSAKATTAAKRINNPRIVETDLTKPYFAWYEQEKETIESAKEQPVVLADSSEAEPVAMEISKVVATLPEPAIEEPVALTAAIEVATEAATVAPEKATVASKTAAEKRRIKRDKKAEKQRRKKQRAAKMVASAQKPAVTVFESFDVPVAVDTKPVKQEIVVDTKSIVEMPSSHQAVTSNVLDGDSESEGKHDGDSIGRSEMPKTGAAEPLYVKFTNESTRLNTADQGYQQLINQLDPNATYFVIGHSHGNSAVGVAKLSQRRAEAVAKGLVSAGAHRAKVHTMASWSTSGVDFAPSLGVQVFMVKSADPERVFLAFSR